MADNKNKIGLLVIVTGLKKAGAELMLFRMLKHLDRDVFSLNVITLSSENEMAMAFRSHGIPVHSLHINGAVGLATGLYKLVRLITKLDPHVVQTWMYHADMLGGVAARMAGVTNVVWSIRNRSLAHRTTKFSTILVAKLCAILSSWLPKVIINCSESARAAHVVFGYDKRKMVVIPNGFELDYFKPVCGARDLIRSELGLSLKTPIVGLIGRYHPVKNHAGFIKAAVKILCGEPSVNFLLAGEGIDKLNVELTKLIKSYNLTDRFHLLGPRSDMPLVMSSLDVLVSSSLGEAFPNVIGEAMACGTPCVATDVGDTAYIIGDTGAVVTGDDAAAIAASVLKIFNLTLHDRESLSQKVRQRVVNNFDIKIVASAYQNVYERLV